MLEDLGILDNITRMAGSSAGAMLASLLAIGYSPNEILIFLYSDTKKIIMGKLTISSRRYKCNIRLLLIQDPTCSQLIE